MSKMKRIDKVNGLLEDCKNKVGCHINNFADSNVFSMSILETNRKYFKSMLEALISIRDISAIFSPITVSELYNRSNLYAGVDNTSCFWIDINTNKIEFIAEHIPAIHSKLNTDEKLILLIDLTKGEIKRIQDKMDYLNEEI